MNSNLQIAGVIVTVASIPHATTGGCTVERGTVAASAAAVGDTVSSDGWDG